MPDSLSALIEEANAEVMLRGNLEVVPQYFAPDYVIHLTDKDLPGGPGTIRQILRQYHSAFSDLQVDVQVLVESADRVAWQRTIRATHTGAFQGFPGTGQQIIWRDMVTSRFREQQFVEDWFITDLAERLLLARRH